MFLCEHCQKSFSFLSNLNRHKRHFHDKSDKTPPNNNVKETAEILSKETTSNFSCECCKKVFTKKFNLNRHLLEVHEIKKNIHISYEFNAFSANCLECLCSFKNIEQLRQHLSDHHNKKFPEELLQFNNKDDFQMWFMNICQNHNTQYFLQTTKKTEEYEISYYYCNRSGKSEIIEGRKRKLKSQGSCKIGFSCTSTLVLRQNNNSGSCAVKYIASHYGHSTQIQHLRIPHADRIEIAENLARGVTTSRILNSHRENISSDKLKRKDLLTKVDINNIKNSFNIGINDGIRHPVDSISVDLWVEEYGQRSSNTIFHKKQGEENDFLSKNDFCLIFFNSSQEYMLKTFGNNGIICIDSTHGLNGYDFELTTVLVIDEWGEGFPAACMFTNRKDTQAFNLFFRKIKEKTGPIIAKTFMSDITNVFYNAWLTVMGPVQYQIFCSWHIDHAWRANLSKINNKEKRENVYHALKVLQTEMVESVFLTELNSFIKLTSEDADTTNFSKYFANNYVDRCEQWAYVYRKASGVNTNMHLESMHKCIKYFHLGGTVVKRLDRGIHAVNSFIRDKTVERMIKQVKGKNTLHINKIEKRHATAVKSKFEVTEQDENTWLVKNDNNIYTICKNPVKIMCCCELKCDACTTCIHTYRCTCIDFFIKATMCKHIHFVIINIIKHNNERYDAANESTVISESDDFNKTDVLLCNRIEETDNNMHIKLKEECLEIVRLDLTHLDTSIMQHALKTIKNLKNLLKSNATSQVRSLTTIAGPEPRPEPTNKKIKKQQNFFSTKKRKTIQASSLAKPSLEQTLEIKSTLLGKEYILKSNDNEHNYV